MDLKLDSNTSWFLSIRYLVAKKKVFLTFICRNIISNANTQMIKDQIKFYCIIQFVTFGWKLPDIKFSSDLIKFHFIYILEADWNNLIQFLNRMCLAFFLALKCCHIMWWWTQSLQFVLQLQFVWCSLRGTPGLYHKP